MWSGHQPEAQVSTCPLTLAGSSSPGPLQRAWGAAGWPCRGCGCTALRSAGRGTVGTATVTLGTLPGLTVLTVLLPSCPNLRALQCWPLPIAQAQTAAELLPIVSPAPQPREVSCPPSPERLHRSEVCLQSTTQQENFAHCEVPSCVGHPKAPWHPSRDVTQGDQQPGHTSKATTPCVPRRSGSPRPAPAHPHAPCQSSELHLCAPGSWAAPPLLCAG